MVYTELEIHVCCDRESLSRCMNVGRYYCSGIPLLRNAKIYTHSGHMHTSKEESRKRKEIYRYISTTRHLLP
jgi:hypothetical protein